MIQSPPFLGVNSGGEGGGPSPYDPATQDWLDRVADNGGTVSTPLADAVDALIVAAKDHGWWARHDRFSMFAGDDLLAAMVPFKVGNGYDVEADEGTVPFDSSNYTYGLGLDSSGADDKWLNTGWTADIVQSTSDAMAWALNIDTLPQQRVMIGAVEDQITPAEIIQIYPYYTDNKMYGIMHTQAARAESPARSQALQRGFLIIDREADDSLIMYVDNTVVGSDGTTNTDPPPGSTTLLFSGRFGGGGTPLPWKGAMGGYGLGQSLGAALIEVMIEDINTYRAAIGALVRPDATDIRWWLDPAVNIQPGVSDGDFLANGDWYETSQNLTLNCLPVDAGTGIAPQWFQSPPQVVFARTGSDGSLVGDAAIGSMPSGAYTLFFVGTLRRPAAGVPNYQIPMYGPSSAGSRQLFFNDAGMHIFDQAGANTELINDDYTDGEVAVVSVTVNGASSSIRINGGREVTGTMAMDAGTWVTIDIGMYPGGGGDHYAWDGTLYEFFVADLMDDTLRNKWEAYLMAKHASVLG